MSDEPELPEYPGHTAAFGRILSTGHDSRPNVSSIGRYAEDLMQLRDDELVLLGQVRAASTLSLWPEALSAEIARRSIVAMNDFKEQSRVASNRLETLTRWLIAFTCAVVLLTIVLVVHDLR